MPTDTKQSAVVQAIIAMGRTMGSHVVAEGVETESQAAVLTAQGCHEMQGCLYGRPMPAGEFAALQRLHEAVRAMDS